jgi:hypothetical protein
MLRNSLLAVVAAAMLSVAAPSIAAAGSPQIQAGVHLVRDRHHRRFDNRYHHGYRRWRGPRYYGPRGYYYPYYGYYPYYPYYGYAPPPPPPPPAPVYPGGLFFGFSF